MCVFTVKSEIFARVYFRETWHMLSFVKIESSRNDAITLLLTDIGKSCPSREFLTSQICLFNAICENKILAKFTDLQYI